MNTLEEQVRDSLKSYATTSRPPADIADAAIAGGRAVRRRRVATAAGLAALAIVAGSFALNAAGPGGTTNQHVGSTPSAAATPSGVGVDVLDHNELRTTDGRTIELTDVDREKPWMVRVPVGWLYSSTAGGTRLLRPDGTVIALAGLPPAPAVSADGRSVAWADGTTASVAKLTADGVRDRVSTPVPAKTLVRTWIGQRVVLGQPSGTGCCDMGQDVWDPAKGAFVPHWAADIAPLYGPVPDGGHAVGLVKAAASGEPPTPGCLAVLDGVRDLSVTSQTCVPGLVWNRGGGTLSPDGRHLAEPRSGTRTEPDSLMIIDVATGNVVRECPGRDAAVWEDNSHLLAADADTDVNRCPIDSSEVTAIPYLQTGRAGKVTLVPRYGV
jgi:hypothetical protein